MQFSEQKGRLYLGRYTQDNNVPTDQLFFYDARDLTTHAVCVGMTGSGKTGLGIALLEEIALNNIPALIIDPKGDMANLLLAFPDLRPSDFRPWVDIEGARSRGLSLDAYANEVARLWRTELANCGITQARIAQFKNSASLSIYTPGSDAGRPISIVHSLQAPPLAWEQHTEILRETISGTVSALLALLNIESDPITGREHSLLSNIIERMWRAGQDMDLAALITQVQEPPFEQLGVLPLEVFYPTKERTKLALALNGLLASPQFSTWLQGDPLQVDALLHTLEKGSKISIFSLAHLSDAERFFFVTLLLEQIRAWLRTQEGTVNLRAVLYFDELFGFMPPHPANPPTKAPLLALMKQARSQGLGLVLATQNPVDLDYKALSNAGTWFIGKLQTANDRQRVLEGLDGASLETGQMLDRQMLGKMLSQLDPRTFLINNVHSSGPRLFRTRHTMSYLRGPLTRDQVRILQPVEHPPVSVEMPAVTTSVAPEQTRSAPIQPVATTQPRSTSRPLPPTPSPSLRQTEAAPRATDRSSGAVDPTEPVESFMPVTAPSTESMPAWSAFSKTRPVLPAGINQYFLPVQVPLEWAIRNAENDGQTIIYRDKQLIYRPAVLARATTRIDNDTRNVHERITISRILEVEKDDSPLDWDAEPLAVNTDALDSRPAQDARFAPLPSQFGDARRIKSLEQSFTDFVYRETAISLLHCPRLKLTALPDEPESRFKRRCYQHIAEQRDAELGKVEKGYQTKIERLEARIRREERELGQDEIEFEARKREELLSAGESVIGLFAKRRSSRMLSTASRKRRLTQQAKAEVQESWDVIADLEGQIENLVQDMENEQSEIQSCWQEIAEKLDQELQTVLVRPRKADIFVEAFGVIWMPHWEVFFDDRGIDRQMSLDAFESTP
ncbi:MAG: ATP-binding protein [Anaerolineae bacterium]|nr:ATP-binding protein [Anaerolineae bacterium]